MCDKQEEEQARPVYMQAVVSEHSEPADTLHLTPSDGVSLQCNSTASPLDVAVRRALIFLQSLSNPQAALRVRTRDELMQRIQQAVLSIDPHMQPDDANMVGRAVNLVELMKGTNLDTVHHDQSLDYDQISQIPSIAMLLRTYGEEMYCHGKIVLVKGAADLNDMGLVASCFDKAIKQLAVEEQSKLDAISVQFTVCLLGGEDFSQSSIWKYDPTNRQHYINVFLKKHFAVRDDSIPAFICRDNHDKQIEQESILMHELGHVFHALLHSAEFRLLNARAKGSSTHEQRMPQRHIIEILTTAFGRNATYGAIGGIIEVVAELFCALVYDVQMPRALYNWYLVNGGPAMRNPKFAST